MEILVQIQHLIRNRIDAGVSLGVIEIIAGRSIVADTGITVCRRLGEGAEAYLVLTPYAFPGQFNHAFVKNIIQVERGARGGVCPVPDLVDECQCRRMVAQPVFCFRLHQQCVAITPDDKVVVVLPLCGCRRVVLILLETGAGAFHVMFVGIGIEVYHDCQRTVRERSADAVVHGLAAGLLGVLLLYPVVLAQAWVFVAFLVYPITFIARTVAQAPFHPLKPAALAWL